MLISDYENILNSVFDSNNINYKYYKNKKATVINTEFMLKQIEIDIDFPNLFSVDDRVIEIKNPVEIFKNLRTYFDFPSLNQTIDNINAFLEFEKNNEVLEFQSSILNADRQLPIYLESPYIESEDGFNGCVLKFIDKNKNVHEIILNQKEFSLISKKTNRKIKMSAECFNNKKFADNDIYNDNDICNLKEIEEKYPLELYINHNFIKNIKVKDVLKLIGGQNEKI